MEIVLTSLAINIAINTVGLYNEAQKRKLLQKWVDGTLTYTELLVYKHHKLIHPCRLNPKIIYYDGTHMKTE